MIPFFQPDWLEHVGVVGPEPGLLWTGLKALDRRAGDRTVAGLDYRLWMWHFSAKTKKKKGWRGLRPWPLRCLSQFLSEKKIDCLEGECVCVPFTNGVTWYL